VKELIASKADIAIAYDPNWLELWSKRFKNPLDDAETFRIDKDGYVTDIGQKASSIEDPQGQYMGLLKFSRGFFNKCLDLMPDVNLNKIDMTSLLNLLIDKNVKIKAIRNLGPWGECDTKHDLRVYE
jgi:choline kinase